MPLDSDIRSILVHVEYIREKIDALEKRADEDRENMQEHVRDDHRQFSEIWTRLSRVSGAIAVIVFLVGAGAAWAALLLD